VNNPVSDGLYNMHIFHDSGRRVCQGLYDEIHRLGVVGAIVVGYIFLPAKTGIYLMGNEGTAQGYLFYNTYRQNILLFPVVYLVLCRRRTAIQC